MQKILVYTLLLLLSFSFALSADASLSIDLQTGWNLVYGFIYTTQITSQSTVLAEHIQVVYAFLPTTQQYVRVYPDPSKADVTLLQSMDDDELVQTAFWVSTTQSGKLIYDFLDTPAPVDGRDVLS